MKEFPENSAANLEKLATTIPFPSYAIDDQTAIKVTDSTVEVSGGGVRAGGQPCLGDCSVWEQDDLLGHKSTRTVCCQRPDFARARISDDL